MRPPAVVIDFVPIVNPPLESGKFGVLGEHRRFGWNRHYEHREYGTEQEKARVDIGKSTPGRISHLNQDSDNKRK